MESVDSLWQYKGVDQKYYPGRPPPPGIMMWGWGVSAEIKIQGGGVPQFEIWEAPEKFSDPPPYFLNGIALSVWPITSWGPLGAEISDFWLARKNANLLYPTNTFIETLEGMGPVSSVGRASDF